MVEILKSFEQAAGRLSLAAIVLPGIVLAVVGLVIWLGGLRLRRVSLALTGLILGGVFVFTTSIHSPAVAGLSILAPVFVAVILPRLFTAVVLAKLVAGILFVILAWSLLSAPATNVRKVSGQQSFSARESLDLLRAYGMDLTDNVKQVGRKLAFVNWLIVAVIGSAVFAVGLLFKHATGAMAFSALGTLLIWTGLAALLMFKGSMPIGRIEHDAMAYSLGAFGMVVFGTIEQFLLCRHADRKREARQHKKDDEEQAKESKRNWRGE